MFTIIEFVLIFADRSVQLHDPIKSTGINYRMIAGMVGNQRRHESDFVFAPVSRGDSSISVTVKRLLEKKH